ncbi:MAG: hypothetical protein QXU99_05655 [Candidatus Bathyarchaeia archaeon]
MKKAVLATFLVLLFAAALLPAVCQAQWTLGIQVGDWFLYRGTLVSWVAGPNVPIPPHQYAQDVVTYNTTDWFRYTVTAISGNNVTFQVVTHWKNGTETTETLVDDIMNSFTMMVIGTNLGPGDQVRPAYDWSAVFGFSWIWPPRILNNTVEDQYLGGSRTANVLDWWHPPLFEGMEPSTRQVYHWDKQTGIQTLYETYSSGTDFTSGESYSYVIRRQLIDSNKAGLVIPEVFTPLVLLVTVSACTIPVVLYRRRKVLT